MIRYVDIAAVSHERGVAVGSLEPMAWGDAPGRARRVVRSGDVLVSTVRPNLRAFAVVPELLDGEVASTGFAVVRASDGVDPGFVWAVVSSDAFVEDMVSKCTGSNYPAIRAKDVAGYRFALPTLSEQRCIADLVSAVDQNMQASVAAEEALRRAFDLVLANAFTEVSGESVRIVDLCSHVVGGVWGSPEGENEVNRLALGPRIYAQGTSDFATDGSPVRSFSAKQAETRTVEAGDIILERSGGSPDQPVGRVAIAGSTLAPCVPTDFQRLLRPDPRLVMPRYLYWRLRSDWANGTTRDYSRRTTGITNLSVKDYIARSISLPGFERQTEVVSLADDLDARIVAARAELAALRSFRSRLVNALLSQEIAIPESYGEELLEAAS